MSSAPLAILTVLVAMSLVFAPTEGSAPSGWTKATATFYGGSDASGTMGMFIFLWYAF